MEVQFEPLNQGLETHGPWHFRDVRFQQDQRAELEAALLQTATIPGLDDTLREISRASRPDCHSPRTPEVTLSVTKAAKPVPQTASPPVCAPTAKTIHSLFPATAHPAFIFAPAPPPTKPLLTFPLPTPPLHPRPHLKRRRPTTDVDGPNTASQGCKKRRLLHQLITSRLSQPFSLPATHILNRESVATGDKRFAKLSAVMSARRLNSAVTPGQPSHPSRHQQQQPNPSTWLWRAAMLNCLRARVCAEAMEKKVAHAQATYPGSNAALGGLQQSHSPGAAIVAGGRYLVTPGNVPVPIHVSPPSVTISGTPHPGHHPRPYPHPTSTSTSTTTTTSNLPPPAQNPSQPPGTCLRIPSPQLRPLRSPELRVTRLPLLPIDDHDLDNLDAADEESMAFPTSEHESRYADDDDEEGVYADFSVIFGGGGGEGVVNREDGGVDGDGDCLEDYMDDLDGIPWGRC